MFPRNLMTYVSRWHNLRCQSWRTDFLQEWHLPFDGLCHDDPPITPPGHNPRTGWVSEVGDTGALRRGDEAGDQHFLPAAAADGGRQEPADRAAVPHGRQDEPAAHGRPDRRPHPGFPGWWACAVWFYKWGKAVKLSWDNEHIFLEGGVSVFGIFNVRTNVDTVIAHKSWQIPCNWMGMLWACRHWQCNWRDTSWACRHWQCNWRNTSWACHHWQCNWRDILSMSPLTV